jgi:predicted DNA-binding transcriptional regulator YafY
MSRDAESDRRVDPYHLTYFNGGAYLVGHCHLRGEARMFAVERIRRLETLRGTFDPPTGFAIDEFLRHAWGLIRGDVVDVAVIFARAVAPYIRERLWHSSQELRELDGGRLELRLRVADTLEVCRWLLGFGADAEVLSPSSLRDALRAEAGRLAGMLATARKPPVRARARSGRRTASAGRRSG